MKDLLFIIDWNVVYNLIIKIFSAYLIAMFLAEQAKQKLQDNLK